MNPQEKRAVFNLSLIMSLRMIGLFMVIPLFALYARELSGATPLLIGLSLGIYGLSQAILQIPFGILSDRFGRKPLIFIGLLLFALGSLMAAMVHSIYGMIIARFLQGAGAVGSTILAMMTDLTRDEIRTKSMAIMGMTIGFSFALAMLLGPFLNQWLSVNTLFLGAMVLGFIAILMLYFFVPNPNLNVEINHQKTSQQKFFTVLFMPALVNLNIGIFILHAIFSASFVVIPISLYPLLTLPKHSHWLIYFPSLVVALILTFFCIKRAEKNFKIKFYFLLSILILGVSELTLWSTPHAALLAAISLCLFFTGFNLLESFLPSLVSRLAPPNSKGSALGIYSCSQFLGIFVGGFLGGWVQGQFGASSVYLFCTMLAVIWLILAKNMRIPLYLQTFTLRFSPQHHSCESIIEKLRAIPGIVDIHFHTEKGIAQLKLARETMRHPDFIRLQEQLQSSNFTHV